MYDFVVVGCGPAGSRFARRASEAGYDVLAFEQGEVGDPLACSGHVSTDLWTFTGDGAHERLLQNEVYGARFHVGGPGELDDDPTADGEGSDTDGPRARPDEDPAPDGAGSATDERGPADGDGAGGIADDGYQFYKHEAVSNVIDRVGLDRHLADLAREAGADLREHHTVTDVRQASDRVEVTARGPDGTETVEARMIAGCDGPRSRVRSALDCPEPGEILHGVLAFDPEPDGGDYVDVHLSVPRFFAWRIPRGDAGVEYGLAAAPGEDVARRFEAMTAAYGVDTEHRCSGAIPIGPPDSVTGERGLLIGDAAAQTKPFTGGGIVYGMTAADHAVRTVDPEDPATLADYERAWRDELEREIRLGHWVRRAYSLPAPVQRAGLRVTSGEIGVHMDRPTSLLTLEGLKKLLTPG